MPAPPSPPAAPPLDPATLARFVDPLPMPPALQPMGTRPDPRDPRRQLPFHRVLMTEAAVAIHRDLPLTRVWTYGASFPGPTLELRRGHPVQIEWINALPPHHAFLPDQETVRAVVHLHGGRVPSDSDGAPDAAIPPGQSVTAVYPNLQDAATLWYHDGAREVAGSNVGAGLLGLALLRDEHEASLGLPGGAQEVPLVLCDRALGQDGQLRAPDAGDLKAHLINGRLFPFLAVEPRRHRLRIANASTSQTYELSLDGGVDVHQIGSDQGLLAAPLPTLVARLAPGERADLTVDFGRAAGKTVVFRSGPVELMQFRVAPGAAARERPLPAQLRAAGHPDPAQASATRTLVLGGAAHAGLERPRLGTTEIWNLVNPTAEMHPIHLHLVRFRLLDRQRFDAPALSAGGPLRLAGPPVPPAAGEAGDVAWKDTIRAEPGMVTRILVSFEGYTGRYAWRCQHLEHGSAEMSGAFQVVGSPT